MDHQTRRHSVNDTRSFNIDELDVVPSPHPIGLGFGAAGGGMAGAAIGSAIYGPIGAAVGAMFGGLVGACGGHGIARAVSGNEGREPAYEHDGCQLEDLPAQDVYTYADKEYARIREQCERAHEDCATLAIPWDSARPFIKHGWSRLSGVIGPRDTDRGLRGGI
jgi:hypothetical protein